MISSSLTCSSSSFRRAEALLSAVSEASMSPKSLVTWVFFSSSFSRSAMRVFFTSSNPGCRAASLSLSRLISLPVSSSSVFSFLMSASSAAYFLMDSPLAFSSLSSLSLMSTSLMLSLWTILFSVFLKERKTRTADTRSPEKNSSSTRMPRITARTATRIPLTSIGFLSSLPPGISSV